MIVSREMNLDVLCHAQSFRFLFRYAIQIYREREKYTGHELPQISQTGYTFVTSTLAASPMLPSVSIHISNKGDYCPDFHTFLYLLKFVCITQSKKQFMFQNVDVRRGR